MMKTSARLVGWILVQLALSPAGLPAEENKKIYTAASNYREAVLHFEEVIRNVRGIERVDERMVDRLEEATKALRLAARNPRHENRLRYAWRDIQPLQLKVESTIFRKYTLNRSIYHAWYHVLYCQAVFADEYLFHLDNPRRGNSVIRRPVRSRPERFVPPPPATSGRIYLQPDWRR